VAIFKWCFILNGVSFLNGVFAAIGLCSAVFLVLRSS